MTGVYEKMRSDLGAVKIYGDSAPVLETELLVYAEEIERLYSGLDSMFRERFVSTAEDMGLSVYEELFGPARTSETTEKRREMLLLRMNLGEGDFTREGIEKALDSLGLDYIISEFPALQKLNVTVTADYTEAEEAFIAREVGKIIPAHIEFQLTFNTVTWAQLDALDRTFGEIDAEDLTWHEADARKASE